MIETLIIGKESICKMIYKQNWNKTKERCKTFWKRKCIDWAYFLEEIAEKYESAKKITLVMDDLNTHTPGSRSMRLFSQKRQKSYRIGLSLCMLPSMEVG